MSELSFADFTAVGFDAKMDSGVLGKVRTIGKLFGTLITLVGFSLSHMELCVYLQVPFAGEELRREEESVVSNKIINHFRCFRKII